MKAKSRITSILNTQSLGSKVTGLPTFCMSSLNLESDLEFVLPTNLRLGHLAEKIVSELIKSSSNYELLYENVQIVKDNKTIGEIDFIVKNKMTNETIHVELAYKFYLFDPSIYSDAAASWIGPNRKDSLAEKLEKLKRKQFPLLFHTAAESNFNAVDVKQVSQALCLLASLFVPYETRVDVSPEYRKAIKGYYLSAEEFSRLDAVDKTYYIPSKHEWGMDPSNNDFWSEFNEVESFIRASLKEKQALLCWQKHKNEYSIYFLVWW